MKNFMLVFILLLFSKFSIAECSSRGMQFFPEQHEIGLHPLIIIQGYGTSQSTILDFKSRAVFLESEQGELVELELQEILKGSMYLTQAVFKSTSPLKSSTTYYLKYQDQTEEEKLQMVNWNDEFKRKERVYWRTAERIENKNCTDLKIEFLKTEVEHYGCGPEAYAIFEVKNLSLAITMFKTELIEIATKKKTVFYIPTRKGALYVGHDMCAGAFSFADKGNYKVKFTPINSDGNLEKSSSWYLFESPFTNVKF